MEMDGQNWRGMHLGEFDKRSPTFFHIDTSVYQNVIYTAG